MLNRILCFFMSILITVCSFLGIHIGGEKEKPEMISLDPSNAFLTIALDENPSTGYTWDWSASDESVLRLSYFLYLPDSSWMLLGSGGVRTFAFAADQPGSTELTFTYQRGWEDTPIRTVVIACTVSPDLTIQAQCISDVS